MVESPVDPCLLPAGPAPPGRTSNLVDPPSLGPAMTAVLSILIAWATVFTAARFYVNFRKLGLGDCFVLLALAMSIAVLAYEVTLAKLARHIWDVPACFFDAEFAKFVYFTAALFNLGQFFAKASIFLLFSQIFKIQQSMRYAIWAGHAFNFMIYWAGFAVATYYETPHVGETWLDTLDGRSLIPIGWWQAQSALSVVLDIYIFVLPLPLLFGLKIALRRRIQLVGVFSLAIMGIGASIASLVQRIQIPNSNDQTWISAVLSLCSAVEFNVAIIVSSAPGFAGFWRSHPLNFSSPVGSMIGSKASSRLGLVDSKDTYGTSNRTMRANVADDPSQNRNSQYYELNDTWMLKSAATADVAVTDRALIDSNGSREGGIMRTIALDQKVRTTSTENLMK